MVGGITKLTRIRNVYPMPFDRWDGDKYVHATGREYWDCTTNGWCTEYEDDATCSLPVTDPEYDYEADDWEDFDDEVEWEEYVLNDLLRFEEE